MEPSQAKVRIYLGEFTVVQTRLNEVTLNIGHNVHVTMHLGFPHSVKEGDTLSLYTEVPCADTRQTPIQ